MKKNGLLLVMLGVTLALGMVVTGCATINKEYMVKDIPVAEHVVLSTPDGVALIAIDKQPGLLYSIKTRGRSVVLPPNEHTIYVQYLWNFGYSAYEPMPQTEAVIMARNPLNITRNYHEFDNNLHSELISFTFKFEPGHFYYLYKPDNASEFLLVDETDPSAAWTGSRAEERITKAKKALGLL
jgi:hypothetical protein